MFQSICTGMGEPPDLELALNRFNRLVKEILQGEVRRTCFQSWEVDLFVDLQACDLTRSRRDEALRRYQRAVQHQIERGQLPPVRFAEFLGRRARKTCTPLEASVAAENPAPLNP